MEPFPKLKFLEDAFEKLSTPQFLTPASHCRKIPAFSHRHMGVRRLPGVSGDIGSA
jgi:hypothetical protein